MVKLTPFEHTSAHFGMMFEPIAISHQLCFHSVHKRDKKFSLMCTESK